MGQGEWRKIREHWSSDRESEARACVVGPANQLHERHDAGDFEPRLRTRLELRRQSPAKI
jgi:hypothetical protein